MKRIYAAAGNCDKILALITAALEKIADTLHRHTSELQSAGRFAGENVTPELRARYSGVNVTNTCVERAFGLEKFLHTRERGSHWHGRRGWVLFKHMQHARLGPAADVGQVEALHARRAQGGGRHG